MISTESPLVSIVIPTYNSEQYIAGTLETVFFQTFKDYEVVVSDDGSSDNTVETVKAFFRRHPDKRSKILENRHEGPGAARNSGIEAAAGEWISFLDSDDKWYPEKLRRVAEYIDRDNGTDLVCHSEIWEDSPGEKLLNYSRSFDRSVSPFLSLYRQNALSTSAVTVRRNMLIKAGLFDTSLPSAQDYDLWLRLALLPGIRIGFIEEPLGEYVTREGNISSGLEKRYLCLQRIGDKYYSDMKKFSRAPFIEKMRYEGKICAGTGLNYIRKRDYGKGLPLFALGMLKWPRFDWIFKYFLKRISGPGKQ